MAEKELGLGVLFYANAGNVLAKITELQAKLKTLASQVTAFGEGAEASAKGTAELSKGVAGVQSSMKSLGKDLNKAAKGIVDTGTAATKTGGQVKNLGGTITTGAASARAAVPYYERLGVAIRSLAAWIPAAMAITGLVTAFQAGRKAVMEYDQALKNLQAITNATEAETSLMGDKIKDVASLTKFSSKEVADAMIFIGQAGFTAGESINTIQAAAMLATGTLSTLSTTSDLLTTALRVFHMEAAESGRVADVFSNAVNKSKITIEGLRVALNYLGPVAYAFGMSVEEASASVMALANSGIRFSTIGTSLRQMLSRLSAPTAKMREEFGAAGVSLEMLKDRSQGMVGVAQNLATVLKGDVSKAFGMFGLRAANAALIIGSLGAEGMEFLIEQASEVGSAVRMAEKQMEGLGVAAKNLRDKLELLAISFGTGGLSAAAKALIDILRPLVDILSKMASSVLGQWIISTAALTLVIIGLGKAFNLLVAAATAFITKVSMKVAFASIAESGGALVFALHGAARAFSALAVVVVEVGKVVGAFVQSALYAVGGLNKWVIATDALSRGMKILWAAMATNPLGFWITLIAGIVSAFYLWNKAQRDNIIATEKAAIVHSNNVKVLNKYLTQIKDQNTTEKERETIVERLISQYPHLYYELDKAKGSVEGYTKALEGEIEKEKELLKLKTKENLENLTKAWEENEDALKSHRLMLRYNAEDMDMVDLKMEQNRQNIGWWRRAIDGLKQTFYALREKIWGGATAIESWSKKVIEAEKDSKGFEKSIAQTIYQLKQIEDVDPNTMVQMFPPEVQEKILKIVAALEKFDEVMHKIKQETEKYSTQFMEFIADLDERWQDYYAHQDEMGKYNTVKFAAELQKQLNELDKQQENLLMSDEQYNRQKELLMDEHFRKMERAYLDHYDKLTQMLREQHTRGSQLAAQEYAQEKTALERWVKEKSAIIDRSEMDASAKQAAKLQLDQEYYNKLKGITTEYVGWERAESDAEVERHFQRLSKMEYGTVEYWATRRQMFDAHNAAMNELGDYWLQGEFTRIHEREEAEKALLDANKLSHEEYQNQINQIEIQANSDRITLLEEVKNVLTQSLEERRATYEQYANLVISYEQKIHDVTISYDEEIARLKRKNMGAEQAALALDLDIKKKFAEAEALIRQGELDKAEEVYKQIRSLAGELASAEKQAADERAKAHEAGLEKIVTAEKKAGAEIVKETRDVEGEAIKARQEKVAEIIKLTQELQKRLKEEQESGSDTQIKILEKLKDKEVELNEVRKQKAEEVRDEYKKMSVDMEAHVNSIQKRVDQLNHTQIELNTESAIIELEKLKKELEETEYKVVISFFGEGSETAPISDKIEEIKGKIGEMQKLFDSITKSFEVVISFKGDIGAGNQSLLDAIKDIQVEFDKVLQHIEENVILIKVDNQEAKTKVQEILDIVLKLTEKVWTVTVNIITKGWEELVKAAAAWSVLEDKTITVTIKTKHEGGGYKGGGEVYAPTVAAQKGGGIPGYGGGDTVPALLERGEWVIPKEQVRQYGPAFMKRLQKGYIPKELLPKYAEGGEVKDTEYAVLSKDAYASLKKDYAVLQPHIKSEGSRVFQNVGSDLNGFTMALDPGQGWSLYARMQRALFAMTNSWRAMVSEATLKAKYKAGQLFPGKTITRLMSESYKKYVDARLPQLTAESTRLHWDTVPGSFVKAYGDAAQNFADSGLESSSLSQEGAFQKGGQVTKGNKWLKNILAYLESGEFVIPKDIVSKQGISFFENLLNATNTMRIPKFHDGGLAGGMATSGQVHTINLTINGEPHTLYGDEVNINKLTTNLRRAQLVRA